MEELSNLQVDKQPGTLQCQPEDHFFLYYLIRYSAVPIIISLSAE